MSFSPRAFYRATVLVGLLLVVSLLLPRTGVSPQALAAPGDDPRFGEADPIITRTEFIEGGSAVRILPSPETMMALGANSSQGADALPPEAVFTVQYSAGWPAAAQQSFEYALALWGTYLSSPIPIVISASWENMGNPDVLGASGPYLVSGFRNQPEPDTFYATALANKIAGVDTRTNVPDIQMRFNNLIPWYLGTDGAPGRDQYDFVTVSMHEVGHGLGFIGGMTFDGQDGRWFYDIPYIYDHFTRDASGRELLSIAAPSVELGTYLTGSSLYFYSPRVAALAGPQGAKLFAPSQWQSGSSYSHFDEAAYPSVGANSLMTPYVANSEVVHVPGPNALAVLEDLGWTIRLTAATAPTPTARPTVLPAPKATPKPTSEALAPRQLYMPVISGFKTALPTSVRGKVTLGGAPAAGISLELCQLKNNTCPKVAGTTTIADGSYSFASVPGPVHGQPYYVRYWNTAVTPGRVYYWAEPFRLQAGTANTVRSFELADVRLGNPADEANPALPTTFTWTMRTASGTESERYTLNLYDPGGDPWFWTDVGHAASYSISTLPAAKAGARSFNYGTAYRWEVWTCLLGGGCGLSLESRDVTLKASTNTSQNDGEFQTAELPAPAAGGDQAQLLFYSDAPTYGVVR